MEEDYDDENVLENIDDEDEEMVNENLKRGDKDKNSVDGDGDKGLGPPNITIKPPGTKQKRRSKNDCNGRDYVCGCGKTYLSYPALYTHIKTKHNGKTPDGTNANQVQNGRGRGRPRKNFLINDDAIKRAREARFEGSLEERHPEFREIYNRKDRFANDYSKEESYINIYNTLGLTGGPVDPLKGFPEMEDNMSTKYSAYLPLYTKVKFIIDNNTSDKIYDSVDTSESSLMKNTKFTVTCDDIYALFLIENSKMLNIKFYKTLVIFLKHFRDCMNLLGWETLSQYKDLHSEPSSLDFTCVKTAEHVPEIANDFVNVFLINKLPSFDRHLAIVLVNHFCDWLFKHKFTHTKISLVNEIEY